MDRGIGLAQHEVELIVLRQAASYLATPILLVDLVGNLIYYNEPAEELLGHRYDETGEIPLEDWTMSFVPTGEDGVALPFEALPLGIAVQQRHPAHGTFSITGRDGVNRRISATALPLEGQAGRQLGSIAVLWEEGT